MLVFSVCWGEMGRLVFCGLEYSVEGFGVDVYPLGLLDMVEVLIEVFAHIELRELFINAPYLLQNSAELLSFDFFFSLARIHAN